MNNVKDNCSNNDKPGKTEVLVYLHKWSRAKQCNGCDKKRTGPCKNSNCH